MQRRSGVDFGLSHGYYTLKSLFLHYLLLVLSICRHLPLSGTASSSTIIKDPSINARVDDTVEYDQAKKC